MEPQSSNNSSSNRNLNIFNAATDTSAHGGAMPYIPQPGPMTALLREAEQGNLVNRERSSQRSPQNITGPFQEQHFSFLNGGRLVIDLNIERGGLAATSEVVASVDAVSSPANVGPRAGNDSSENGPRCSCGRKRKTPDSEGTSRNPDADQECQCEITPVQGSPSGTVNPNGGSSSRGHARGVEISGGATSQANPNVPNRDENRIRSVRSRRRGIPQRSIISAAAGDSSIGSGQAIGSSVGQAIGSRVGQAIGSSVGALGGTSAQRYTNSQAAGGSSTGMVQQLYQQPGEVSIGNVNQGDRGNHRMQLRPSVNRRDPRLNGDQNMDQPTGNVPPLFTLRDYHEGFAPTFPQMGYLHEMTFNSTAVHHVLQLLGVRPVFFRGNQVLNVGENDAEQLDRMRLDIDNMTYEQLLALEEQIGSVNTGLSEETIAKGVNRCIYLTVKNKTPEEIESCCICLDEYENRQELGKLDCGHDFHFDCIKQWLMQKNCCPVCKKTAFIKEES